MVKVSALYIDHGHFKTMLKVFQIYPWWKGGGGCVKILFLKGNEQKTKLKPSATVSEILSRRSYETQAGIELIFDVLFSGWKREAEDEKVQVVTPAPSTENPTPETEEVVSEEQKESDLKDVEAETSVEDSENTETSSADHLSCLTVQPNRVRCGVREQ